MPVREPRYIARVNRLVDQAMSGSQRAVDSLGQMLDPASRGPPTQTSLGRADELSGYLAAREMEHPGLLEKRLLHPLSAYERSLPEEERASDVHTTLAHLVAEFQTGAKMIYRLYPQLYELRETTDDMDDRLVIQILTDHISIARDVPRDPDLLFIPIPHANDPSMLLGEYMVLRATESLVLEMHDMARSADLGLNYDPLHSEWRQVIDSVLDLNTRFVRFLGGELVSVHGLVANLNSHLPGTGLAEKSLTKQSVLVHVLRPYQGDLDDLSKEILQRLLRRE